MTQGFVPQAGSDSAAEFPGVWNDARSSLLSLHAGTSRPSYAVAGTLWINSSTNVVCLYDGSQDIPVFSVDTTAHLLVPPVGGGTEALNSAATTDLGAKQQLALTINGTTTITSFGSSMKPGQIKVLTFADALTLTHGSALLLPGLVNITTAAGDVAIVLCASAGNYRVISFQPAAGIVGTLGRGASLYQTGAQSLAITTLTKINFDAERFDDNGEHSNTTNNSRITVVNTGRYLIIGTLALDHAGAGSITASIYVNNAEISRATGDHASTSTPKRIQVTCIAQLSAGNYVELAGYHSCAGSVTTEPALTNLQLARIG